jgi:N6-adenosine-specific RNA methylase IME4
MSVPDGGFRTIVIDPPWPGPGEVPAFDSQGSGEMRLSLIPYATMTGIQVAALNVRELAADDAQLFIWATSRSLGDAMLLGQSWAFKFRGVFIWHKPGLGMGRHVRSQAEFLYWFGRRGAPLVEPKRCPRQIQTWPKPKRHSEKPPEAYQMIAELSPAPRLDIFARQHRPGFEAFGNEVGE